MTEHVAVSRALAITGFSRRAMYHWIMRLWVHAQQLKNGYWMICIESLPSKSRRPFFEPGAAEPPIEPGDQPGRPSP